MDHHGRWDEIKVVYNGSRAVRTAAAGGGSWEVPCDGEDSMLWKKHIPAEDSMLVAPWSVLVLGHRAEETEEKDRIQERQKIWA